MFLGIEDHIWIIGIVVGALVATSANQMRPKNHIPLLEIYMKKGGAIVWFVDANDQWWPYTLKNTRHGYFAMYTSKVKGVYHINTKHRFYFGGSSLPNYVISVRDMNNYNPIDIGLVNDFLAKNSISKLERKHITQAKKLRMLLSRFNMKKDKEKSADPIAISELEQISRAEKDVMDEEVDAGLKAAQDRVDAVNNEQNSDYKLDDRNAMLFLVDYMLKKDLIDEMMAQEFIFKIENGIVNLDGLKDKLRNIPVVELSHSMEVGIQNIVEEFGSQNPLEIVGIIDDARTNIKELKKMTPVPVKQFIPGGVILSVGIVAMLFMVLLSNGTIGGDLLGGLPGLPGLP